MSVATYRLEFPREWMDSPEIYMTTNLERAINEFTQNALLGQPVIMTAIFDGDPVRRHRKAGRPATPLWKLNIVAQAYRVAVLADEPTAIAVMRAFPREIRNENAARQWIMRARRAGLLEQRTSVVTDSKGE